MNQRVKPKDIPVQEKYGMINSIDWLEECTDKKEDKDKNQEGNN
jgi:hypothetical protein